MSEVRDRSPISKTSVSSVVRVTNLPFSLTWEEIKVIFEEQIGEVKRVILLKTEDGQSNGTAVIKFASQGLAEQAVTKMDKFKLNGRQINVKPEVKLTTSKAGVKSGDAKPKSESKPQPGKSGAKSQSGGFPQARKILVTNLPYDMTWQDLRQLFIRIGQVKRVELHTNEQGKSKGKCFVVFASDEKVSEAVVKMNNFEVKGRKIHVQEVAIDKQASVSSAGKSVKQGRNFSMERPSSSNDYGNTYGLSVEFLMSLGITTPFHTKLFVSNLDYTVDEKKLREVFRLAGRGVAVEILRDKEGNSRGFARIEYNHPIQAVQAISMLDNQILFGREMRVRIDNDPDYNDAELPSVLPEGLMGVGRGLGEGGMPLTKIPKNLESQPRNDDVPMDNNGGSENMMSAMAANTLAPAIALLAASQLGMGLNNQLSTGQVGGFNQDFGNNMPDNYPGSGSMAGIGFGQSEYIDRGFQGVQGGINEGRGGFVQESQRLSRFDTNRLGPPAYDPFSRSEGQRGFDSREEIQIVRSEFGQSRNFDSDAVARERRTLQYDVSAERRDFERNTKALFNDERGGGVFSQDFGMRNIDPFRLQSPDRSFQASSLDRNAFRASDEGVQSFGQRNQSESNFGRETLERLDNFDRGNMRNQSESNFGRETLGRLDNFDRGNLRNQSESNFGREALGRLDNFDRGNLQTQSFPQRNLPESNLEPRGDMSPNFGRENIQTHSFDRRNLQESNLGREMTSGQNFGSKIERAPEFDRKTNEPQAFGQGNQVDKIVVSKKEDFNRPPSLDREFVEATKMASTIDQLTKETNFGERSLPIVSQQSSKAPSETEGNRNVVTTKRPFEEPIPNHQGSWQSRLAAMDKGPASKMDSSALYSRASGGQSGLPLAESNNRLQPMRQTEPDTRFNTRFNTPAATKAPIVPQARFIAQLVEKQEQQQQQQGRFQATKMDDDVVITGVTQRANSNPMSGPTRRPAAPPPPQVTPIFDTVEVTNLPDDLDWQELGNTFMICGDVKTAIIKNRGTGLVRFHHPSSAKKALGFNNTIKWGRHINVGIF